MERLDEADPVWGQTAEVYRVGRDDRSIRSHRTGNFVSPNGFSNYIKDWTPAERAKISTWILNRNIAGDFPTIDVAAINAIRVARPLTISQKIDRFLLMLENQRFRPGDALLWRAGAVTDEYVRVLNQTMMWIESASDMEAYAFGPVLQQAGIIEIDPQTGKATLAYGGYQRLEKLQAGGFNSDQAFVAMWFSPETQAAYDEGIAPALIRAGYHPQRIDQKEHNNKIDDEIIAEIRRSRFIVADFTCGIIKDGYHDTAVARGGVYYEAGFAQGLGLPVVWTVRADQIGLVHFDTRQFNHITWETPTELSEKLYNRIAAVIGVNIAN
jgi:hypothetical protein